MASRPGFRLYLSSVNVHSTWGATSANTLRVKSCGFHLPELCGQDFLGHMANRIFSSPNRFVPGIKSRRRKAFHLLLMKVSVAPTGQAALLCWFIGNFLSRFHRQSSFSI